MFASKAQRGYLYAKHPDIAKKWSKEYPSQGKLPEHVKKRPPVRKQKRGSTLVESIILLCLFTVIGVALMKCTPSAVAPIKAAAQDVVTYCSLDITVRECLHQLIDEVGKQSSPKPDGGVK